MQLEVISVFYLLVWKWNLTGYVTQQTCALMKSFDNQVSLEKCWMSQKCNVKLVIICSSFTSWTFSFCTLRPVFIYNHILQRSRSRAKFTNTVCGRHHRWVVKDGLTASMNKPYWPNNCDIFTKLHRKIVSIFEAGKYKLPTSSKQRCDRKRSACCIWCLSVQVQQMFLKFPAGCAVFFQISMLSLTPYHPAVQRP